MKMFSFNQVGEKYKDFRITKAVEIHEIQCFLRELLHEPSGAKVMHLACDDPENLFCLSFRTLPDSSDGVAHVLEHTVLCGSEKFPVKDPFFAMTRRSMNTFMNALTGSDFTCYPAASQIPKDFYNLLEVYLDAVFKPLLNEMSFLQEGHRFEFSSPQDPQSPLIHKGIVFNEMKGALASGNARLIESMNKALFPSLPYGYNSGGEPKEIEHLSYHELCAFHQRYYQPSLCLFFFYGNMPLEGHLDFIAERALKNVKKIDPLPGLPMQPRFGTPVVLFQEYSIDEDEDPTDKTIVGFGWLTCHILKQLDVLALNVLEILLMDTDASPLKHAFLKSGLCKQVSIYTDVDINEVPVMLIFRGCAQDAAPALNEIFRSTLSKVIEDGIPLTAFESAMHQLEFSRSEIGGNHSPFGLTLFMRSALLQQHGGDPENGLMIHSLFDQLQKKQVEDPQYLVGLLKKYFLENPHFVQITMLPSKELAAKEKNEELQALEQMKKSLTAGQVKHILDQSEELAAFQKKQQEEDIDLLPKIKLDEVPTSSIEYPLHIGNSHSFKTYHHDCFTNNIIYADLFFGLPDIPKEDLMHLRLFTLFLPQVGAGGRNYLENLDFIQAHTGGIGAGLALHTQVTDHNQFHPALHIRGKALYREAKPLFLLLKDVINSLDFKDLDRLKEILLKQYTSMHSTLTQNAMRYASTLAASTLDTPSWLTNLWYGLDFYRYLRNVVANLDAEINTISHKMEELRNTLFSAAKPDLVLACSKEMYEVLRDQEFYGLTKHSIQEKSPWKLTTHAHVPTYHSFLVATPVAFISHVIKTVPYVHPDAPALMIAACLFENIVLHTKIREQGGAYGGGASFNSLSGNFSFYAYRDPNILFTLKAFDEAIEEIIKVHFEESDLEEAKLEVFQSLDSPVSPGNRAELAYTRLKEGKTPAIRQAFRSKLLNISREEIINAVKKYIQSHRGNTVVFSGKELLERENAELEKEKMCPFPIEAI